MYSIHGIKNIFDVMEYTVSALKEVGYTENEISSYVSAALSEENNLGIIRISEEWLDECNRIYNEVYTDKKDSDYTSDDYDRNYYSQFWADDGERYNHTTDDEIDDMYDYLNVSYRNKDTFDKFNCIDPDEEVYEGFSSCRHYYWDRLRDNY